VLSCGGLCEGLITGPEESYRVCVTVCDLKTSRMRPWAALGRSATGGEKMVYCHLQAFGDLGVFPVHAEGWATIVSTSTLTNGEEAFCRERKLPRCHHQGWKPGCTMIHSRKFHLFSNIWESGDSIKYEILRWPGNKVSLKPSASVTPRKHTGT
jgi:hypothetical protein